MKVVITPICPQSSSHSNRKVARVPCRNILPSSPNIVWFAASNIQITHESTSNTNASSSTPRIVITNDAGSPDQAFQPDQDLNFDITTDFEAASGMIGHNGAALTNADTRYRRAQRTAGQSIKSCSRCGSPERHSSHCSRFVHPKPHNR